MRMVEVAELLEVRHDSPDSRGGERPFQAGREVLRAHWLARRHVQANERVQNIARAFVKGSSAHTGRGRGRYVPLNELYPRGGGRFRKGRVPKPWERVGALGLRGPEHSGGVLLSPRERWCEGVRSSCGG